MNHDILVEQFCTPPDTKETPFDLKAYDEKSSFEVEFEDRIIKAYSIGEGPNVLLVHGWGSRASHLALIAKVIAKSGFRVVVYDGPAHANTKKKEGKDLSNMFEFGKAVSCMANHIGDIYAVVGHSLGAMASAFTISGIGIFSEYKFAPKKLILISSPVSVHQVLDNYSVNRDEFHLLKELTNGLQNAFNFNANDYDLLQSLQYIDSDILVLHDENDEEVPVTEALLLKEKYFDINLQLTQGYGHNKILVNRTLLNSIKDFLEE